MERFSWVHVSLTSEFIIIDYSWLGQELWAGIEVGQPLESGVTAVPAVICIQWHVIVWIGEKSIDLKSTKGCKHTIEKNTFQGRRWADEVGMYGFE